MEGGKSADVGFEEGIFLWFDIFKGLEFDFGVKFGYEDFIDGGVGLLWGGVFSIFSLINSVEERVHEDC